MQTFPLELQWHMAAWRVRIKLLRLRLAMLKAGYDPNQPRAPAGTAVGGQWVSEAGAEQSPVHVAVSAYDNPGLYYVDLEQEDKKGGHGFSKHVGKSASYLKSYMIAWNINPNNGFHPAEGSFYSLGEANNLVSTALRAHPDIVQ